MQVRAGRGTGARQDKHGAQHSQRRGSLKCVTVAIVCSLKLGKGNIVTAPSRRACHIAPQPDTTFAKCDQYTRKTHPIKCPAGCYMWRC